MTSLKAIPLPTKPTRKGFIAIRLSSLISKYLPIIDQILAESPTPPVIILQGDHGTDGFNRMAILNSYYVPDEMKEQALSRASARSTASGCCSTACLARVWVTAGCQLLFLRDHAV